MLMKKIFGSLVGFVMMVESCEATEMRLNSLREIYSCAEKASSRVMDAQTIKKSILSTMADFSNNKSPNEIKAQEIEWQNANKIAMLWSTMKCFNDLEIAPYCMENIMEIVCGSANKQEQDKVHDKNFKFSRFLLMSQCKVWNETSNTYELKQGYSSNLVGEAIGKLQSAINGDTKESTRLLDSLKESKQFGAFLG